MSGSRLDGLTREETLKSTLAARLIHSIITTPWPSKLVQAGSLVYLKRSRCASGQDRGSCIQGGFILLMRLRKKAILTMTHRGCCGLPKLHAYAFSEKLFKLTFPSRPAALEVDDRFVATHMCAHSALVALSKFPCPAQRSATTTPRTRAQKVPRI